VRRNLWPRAVFLLILWFAGERARAGDPWERQEFVMPPQKPGEQQGNVGFCWAYALASYLELNRGDDAPNLSEEYLGFYHLYQQLRMPNPLLLWSLNESTKSNLLNRVLGQVGFLATRPQEGSLYQTALEDLDQYGIVPESVFVHKFQSPESSLSTRLAEFLKKKYAVNAARYAEDPAELRRALEEVYGVRVPAPDQEFIYQGHTYTPRTFARDFLKFKAENYRVVQVNRTNHSQALGILRDRFRDGQAVPIAFTVLNDKANQHNGIFSPENCNPSPCKFEGRHAVLAVNSVIPQNFSLSATTGLIIRNSWGNSGLPRGLEFDSWVKSFWPADLAMNEERTPLFLLSAEYLESGFDHFPYWEYLEPVTN
jgi:hypothetical protein